MKMDLCRKCAEKLKVQFDVVPIVVGVDRKITCTGCGLRRFGAIYELTKKEAN